MSSSEEERLTQRIEQALEILDRGDQPDLEALCDGDPRMIGLVAAALGKSDQLKAQVGVAPRDPLIGDVVGERYRFEERIGAGAMGVVYRGVDLELRRDVAIKVLRPELVVGERFDTRLAREGEVLASIRHPGVLSVFDRGKAADGRTFLVVELLDGCSGAELLSVDQDHGPDASAADRLDAMRRLVGDEAIESDNDARQFVRWMADAAACLDAAHTAGVVHRDVKPSNLFIERTGRVVLLDFGIVSIGSHVTLGGDGSPLGTPAFMAPEQLDPEVEPDARTDVYGLAATLFQFVTGHAPFTGTPHQVLTAIARGDTPRADLLRPGLPRDLLAILEKGMAHRSADRYPSAMAMRDDLLAWLDHRPVSARRLSPVERTWRRLRRSTLARAVAAVLLVGGIGVGLWAWNDRVHRETFEQSLRLCDQIPPSLLASRQEFRATSAVTHSESVRQTFDDMIELGHHAHIGLTLRAIQRSDAGDLEGAANDMDQLAQSNDAPFASLAAERYRAGELPDATAAAVKEADYGSATNRLVILCHALRSPKWRLSRVKQMATEQARSDEPLLDEILLVAHLRRARSADLNTIENETIRLVERRGRLSALTCYLLANVRIGLGQPAQAFEDAKIGIGLGNEDFILQLLVGSAAHDQRDWQTAEPQLLLAAQLQPRSQRAQVLLYECMLLTDRFDEARVLLDEIPFGDNRPGRTQRIRCQGLLPFMEAMKIMDQGGKGSADKQHAIELLHSAQKIWRHLPRFGRSRSIEEIACDLEIEPTDKLRGELIRAWAKRPYDIQGMLHMYRLLSESGLREREVRALMKGLRDLCEHLSDDPSKRNR